MSLFLAVKVSLRVAREEITKQKEFWFFIFYSIHINKVLFICLFHKQVSFRGLHKLRPRPDWSLLGVKFKISDEHPRPLHMGAPPPPPPPPPHKQTPPPPPIGGPPPPPGLKTHQMFSFPTSPEKFENATITLHLICVWIELDQGNHMTIVTSSFRKSFVFKMFSLHTKTQSRVFKFLRFGERFRKVKPRFRDGLVWTEGLTWEIKFRFQIPPTYCGQGLRCDSTLDFLSKLFPLEMFWEDAVGEISGGS